MCKHRIAYGIAKRAQALASQEVQALDAPASSEATQKEAQPAVASVGLPEAPASVNVYVEIAGRKVQITLRDTDEDRLMQRLERMMARYPVSEAAVQPPTPPAAPAAAAADEVPGLDHCPLHPGELMRLHTKNGQQWRSHRLADDTWCRGK
jgi:hypothetical protein